MKHMVASESSTTATGRDEGCGPALPAGWWMIPATFLGSAVWAVILF